MESSVYKYRINTLKFNDAKTIIPGKINVFVGANNCGKTQALKDILSNIIGITENHIIFDKVDVNLPETWVQMKESYNLKLYDTNTGKKLQHVSPTLDAKQTEFNANNLEESIELWLHREPKTFKKYTGQSFVTYLNTDNRLKLASAQSVQNLEKNGAKNVLEALYLSGQDATILVRKNIKKIFNTDIYLDASNLGMLQYKVGKDLSSISDSIQKSYAELLSYPLLDTQGDGLRSAVGIISALTAVKKPIVLIDEPEAFLHPPQALKLGEFISDLVDDSQQVFIATHSADFLRGLLSTTRDAVIVHLDRISEEKTISNPLDSATLEKIITNPLLSSSRVLEGMFYKGIVATEADADTVFYQRLFQKVNAAEEIHFVNAHNKQTLKNVIEPYQKLNIRFAMIADADVIRDRHDFIDILNAITTHEEKENILSLRDKVYDFFQTKSKYDILLKLQDETTKLAAIELPDSSNNEETSKALFEFRKELKKLREESDILAEFKDKGKKSLPIDLQTTFDSLCVECSKVGLFIVPVGELESWLVDYEVPKIKNKTKWITSALDKLFSIEYDENKEIWRFIDSLKKYLTI